MPPRWVDIDVNGQTMEGYLAQPEGDGSRPAVVVIQEIWGVNSHIQAVTDKLPASGYVGLAPAMFHRQGRMTMGLHEEMDTAIANMGTCTDADIVADVHAAVDYLKGQSFVQGDRIGIVGFCFGGRVSYLAACNVPDLKASVVYYGGASRLPWAPTALPRWNRRPTSARRCSAYSVRTTRVPPLPMWPRQKLSYKKTTRPTNFTCIPGCGHGFNCESRDSYRPEAAADAWSKAIAWFDKHLKA